MALTRVIHLSKMTGMAGSEGHLLILLAGLRARGLDAQLWILVESNNPVQSVVDQAIQRGIPVRRVAIPHHLSPGLWKRLQAEFRAARPDVVHTHLLHADLYGIPAARWAQVPVVISSRHNDDKFRSLLPVRLLNRGLWRLCDAGIAISEAIRRFSIEVEGAHADQVTTIRYGLDPADLSVSAATPVDLRASLQLPPNTVIIGSVCRLIEQKGLTYALRAFAQVAPDIPDTHYVIVGDGNLRASLEAEARHLNIADRVHFLGWREDAREIMAGFDVLLAPSLWEGFGLVLLEAMAHSLPVISTQVSAIPEVVADGETGWLVPPADPAALASALRIALLSPAERRARGAAGRRRLESYFSVDRMVDQTLAVYQSLDARKTRR